MNVTFDPATVSAIALIAVRIAAFLAIAPPFSSTAFPLQLKAALSVLLALVLVPRVAAGYTEQDTGPFLLALVFAAVTGAALGFLVYIAFAAVQVSGSFLDQFGGFAAAEQYDPGAGTNGAQFTRLYQMTALALLFASDGYQLILGGLVRSFTAIPIAAHVDIDRVAQSLAGSVTQLFVSALQIAGPTIVVLFLANVALGLLTRVSPAMNAFTLGPPAFTLVTVLLTGFGIVALPAAVNALAASAGQLIGGL
ncbi:MAG TPA: flagellar biosynthetic protein FliR [Microbacteriaceae bacterium]|nr:flagellar biosynthetic protein FliR [Microbacteriaceae bacterium]